MCRSLRAQWHDASILVGKAPGCVSPIIFYVSCKTLQRGSRNHVNQRQINPTWSSEKVREDFAIVDLAAVVAIARRGLRTQPKSLMSPTGSVRSCNLATIPLETTRRSDNIERD